MGTRAGVKRGHRNLSEQFGKNKPVESGESGSVAGMEVDPFAGPITGGEGREAAVMQGELKRLQKHVGELQEELVYQKRKSGGSTQTESLKIPSVVGEGGIYMYIMLIIMSLTVL